MDKDSYPSLWDQNYNPGVQTPDMPESERAVVKTYVPQQQKSEWKHHADKLDMSQSEFIRTMVQAGRRTFDDGDPFEATTGAKSNDQQTNTTATVEGPDPSDATPGVDGLESRVLDALESGPKSWDELLEAIAGDLEADLDDTLQSLQESGTVRYSGRTGGYERVDT